MLTPTPAGPKIGIRQATFAILLLVPQFALAQIHVSPMGTDSGDGRDAGQPVATIGYALTQVNADEEIRVAEGTYAEAIRITASQVITGGYSVDFTALNHPNPPLTILKAPDGERPVLIEFPNQQATVTINGLNIIDGNASTSTILPGHGGGICAIGGGTLEIRNSRMQNNRARVMPDTENNLAFGKGGAIYIEGRVSLHGTRLQSNRGTVTYLIGLTLQGGGGYGGGIYCKPVGEPFEGGHHVLVAGGSLVTLNVANSSSSAGLGHANAQSFGGAIALESLDSKAAGLITGVRIENSTISSNNAKTGDEAESFGGGIYVNTPGVPSGPAITIFESTLSDNRASNATQNLVTFGTGSRGGGIFAVLGEAQEISITNSSITGNIGEAGGGNTFGTGGAIAVEGGTTIIRNSTVSGNRAAENSYDGRGGAIDCINGALTIQGSQILDNTASHNPEISLGADGGAIFARSDNGKPILITNSLFNNNNSFTNSSSNNQRGGDLFFDSPDASIVIIHNTFNGTSTRVAIHAEQGGYTILNNIFAERQFAINTSTLPTGLVDFNLTANGVALNSGGPAPIVFGENNKGGDPIFLDPPGFDFRISGDSPARDGGIADGRVPDDFFGTIRDENPDIGFYEVVLVAPDLYDFGDAPAPYPTLLSQDGARHKINEEEPLYIGIGVDAEPDGQPHAQARGDDNNGVNDEVEMAANKQFCPNSAEVIFAADFFDFVNVNFSGPGFVNVWIDYGNDGSWDEEQDHRVKDLVVTESTNDIRLNMIQGVGLDSFARLRFSSQAGLGPKGEAPDGEVIDFRIIIATSTDRSLQMDPAATLGNGLVAQPIEEGVPFGVTIRYANNGPVRSVPTRVYIKRRALSARGVAIAWQSFLTVDESMSVIPAGTSYTNDEPSYWDVPGLAPGESLEMILMHVPDILGGQSPRHFGISVATGCPLQQDAFLLNNDAFRIFGIDNEPHDKEHIIRTLLGLPPADRKGNDGVIRDSNGDAVEDIADHATMQAFEADLTAEVQIE